MGKVIARKIRGLNLWAKVTLTLVFTLTLSVFMYEGWYNPHQTHAAITAQAAWTQLYASSAFPAGALTTAQTVNAGTNRLLVVAIASTMTTAASQTVTNVTWNGKPLTLAAGDAANTANPNHTYLYYLKDADMPAITTTANVTATITSGGATYYTYVYGRVYTGVDQLSANPFTDAKNINAAGAGDTTVGPFSPALNIAQDDQAIMIANLARTSSGTTARTITGQSDTTWNTATVAASYNAVAGYCVGLAIRDRNVLTASTAAFTFTASNTAWDSMSAMSIKAAATASTNADLSNLVLSSGTLSPAFSSAITSYTASVANSVSSITITPTEADTTATTTVNGTAVNSGTASGPIALAVGSNTITTVVTAQDGITTKTYTVVVTRAAPPASTNANLSNLGLSAGTLNPAFVTGTISYTSSVANPVSSITVTPTVEDATATVKVNGTTVASGTASAPISLVVGSNTITTVVTAQDGTTTKTYTVTVTRAAAVNGTTAGALTFSGITNNTITVTAPFTGDDNTNNSCVIKWGTVNGTYPNTAASTKSGNSYVATVSGLSATTTYYFQATFTDAEGVTGSPVTGSQATVIYSNPLMHSGANLGTKYSGGTWGAGKDCSWCHSGNTANIKQLAAQIDTPTGLRTVVFNRMTATVPTATGTMGNDQRSPLTKSDHICEVCHHQTLYHQYSSSKVTVTKTHNNRTDCMTCHPHGSAFKASGHNVPYYATSTGHTGCATGIGCHTNSSPGGTYPNGGAPPNCQSCHTKGDPLTANIGCGSCHGAAGGNGTPDGSVAPNIAGSHAKHTAGGELCTSCHDAGGDAGNPADHGPGFRGTNTPVVNLASTLQWTGAPINKCNNATCHANVYGTGYTQTPAWGTSAGCSACHTTYPIGVSGPATGGHSTHSAYACTNCHATGTTATTAPSNANGHTDNDIDIVNVGYQVNVPKHPANDGYGGRTCSTTCHGSPYSAGAGSTPVWGSTGSGCGACHNNAANNNNQGAFVAYSSPSTQAGPMTGSHDEHLNYDRYVCNDCHLGAVSGTTGGNNHANGTVTVIQYAAAVTKHAAPFTYLANGCAAACHITATWGGQLGCINCHAAQITRKKGRPGWHLDPITPEFGKTYGHKKTGRNPVSDDDCIVCHLEGRASDHRTSKYHADGNIDLRDPWGTGETPITNMSGGAFTFQRFSTSYAAGSRSSSLNSNDIAQVITLRFCIRCHSKQGATNPTARSANGTPTGSANMPFGGTTGYTVTAGNGVTVAGGTINVFSQFSSGNSSTHPVRGPLNRDFPTNARLNTTYQLPTSRPGTAGTKSQSVMINCFDCHNSNAAPLLTLRTVSAHGTPNTAQVRGTFYVTGPTLCIACHVGYNVAPGSSSSHGAGSALNFSVNSAGCNTWCNNCHGNSGSNAAPTTSARPTAAADYHGFNTLLDGTNWVGTGTTPITGRPFGFIRNITNFYGHRPQSGGSATGATCQGGSGRCAGNNGTRTYSPGGAY